MEHKLKFPHRFSRSGALSALGFLLALAALLAYPETVRQSVAQSIVYCLTALTPSLFPYMALASFAVRSPASAFLGRFLRKPVRWLFRLPGCCGVPVFMSFLGGYPAGARGASLLLEQGLITQEQAGRMLLFCVNPGLAFAVSFIGFGVLGSPRLGLLLFASVTLSGLLLGVITAFRAPLGPEPCPVERPMPLAPALMASVRDASRSTLMMCACVVLFSGFTSILLGSGLYGILAAKLARTGLFSPFESAAVLAFLLEVTGGVGEAARFQCAGVFYAFGLAFGGLCVHLQVFSFFSEIPCKLWKFFLCRLVHGLMASGCFLLLGRLLPRGAVEALAPVGAGGGVFSGTLLGGGSLLLMCGAFLLLVEEGRKKAR